MPLGSQELCLSQHKLAQVQLEDHSQNPTLGQKNDIPYRGHVLLDLDPLTDKLCCLLKPAHFRNYSVILVASSNLTLSNEFFVVENFGIIFLMHMSIALKYELLNTMLEC